MEGSIDLTPLIAKKPEIVDALKHIWIHYDRSLGVRRFLSIYTFVAGLHHAPYTYPRGVVQLQWLYDVIDEFSLSTINYTRDSIGQKRGDASFLRICASIITDYQKRVQKIDSLLHLARRRWKHVDINTGEPQRTVIALFDNKWSALIVPLVLQRVEQIAWQIYMGQHAEWKAGGEEWRDIERFYDSLGQRVTVTSFTITASLLPVQWVRRIYLMTRPVNASEKNFWESRRNKSDQRNDGRAGSAQTPVDRYRDGVSGGFSRIPISYRHWTLVVKSDQSNSLWELEVDEGRNKLNKRSNCHLDPSNSKLVGYTGMNDDEISASAEDALRYVGEMYSFDAQNCQLFFYTLLECIRIPHTLNDAFANLHVIRNTRVLKVAHQRLHWLGSTLCVSSGYLEHLQSVPTLFGTINFGILVTVSVCLLGRTLINSGVGDTSLLAFVVLGWWLSARNHMNLYLWRSMGDRERRRLRSLDDAENAKEKIAIDEGHVSLVEMQPRMLEQAGMIVGMDDQGEEIQPVFDGEVKMVIFGLSA